MKDFYTVKEGKVLMVNDGLEQATGDTLIDLVSQCKRIGIYNPNKKYKRLIKDYSYSELNKLHKFYK